MATKTPAPTAPGDATGKPKRPTFSGTHVPSPGVAEFYRRADALQAKVVAEMQAKNTPERLAEMARRRAEIDARRDANDEMFARARAEDKRQKDINALRAELIAEADKTIAAKLKEFSK